MIKDRIYLSPPHMSGEEQKFIDDAFTSNWIAPLGPNVDAFEDELAATVGTKGAVALVSGTAALHLALILVGVEPGDTVFCSSLTFIGSINPVLYMNAEPVFIDSEPQTWNMSPRALEKAFADAEKAGTLPRAVVVVHLYGQSADMEPIMEICDRYEIPVIEDAAESLGATYRGKASGTIGKFGVFSFNGNKIITTSGGGMLVSNDRKVLEKARFLASQAREPTEHYQHREMGYNYRLSNILAGVGRGQLRVLEERIGRRRAIFERYFNALSNLEGIEFMPEASAGRSTRWLTALLLAPGSSAPRRSEIINYMDQHNIETRPVWKPMHLQPLFRDLRFYPHDAEGYIADQLFERGLCLPSGSSLTDEQQNRVISCFKDALKL